MVRGLGVSSVSPQQPIPAGLAREVDLGVWGIIRCSLDVDNL
jgi:hypothetical protein